MTKEQTKLRVAFGLGVFTGFILVTAMFIGIGIVGAVVAL